MQHDRISGRQSTLKNQLYLKEMILGQPHKKRRISNLRFEKQVNGQVANLGALRVGKSTKDRLGPQK